MPPPRTEPPQPKKRRTFFASRLETSLPLVAPSPRTSAVSTEKVLAALGPPQVAPPPPAKPIQRPRRETREPRYLDEDWDDTESTSTGTGTGTGDAAQPARGKRGARTEAIENDGGNGNGVGVDGKQTRRIKLNAPISVTIATTATTVTAASTTTTEVSTTAMHGKRGRPKGTGKGTGKGKGKVAGKGTGTGASAVEVEVQPKRRGRPPKQAKLANGKAKAQAVGARSKRVQAVQAVMAKVIKRKVRPIKGMMVSEEYEATTTTIPANTNAVASSSTATFAAESSRTKFWRPNGNGSGPTDATSASATASDKAAANVKKAYMTSGMYCQDATAKSPHKLINKVLERRKADLAQLRAAAKGKSRAPRSPPAVSASAHAPPTFPPLPYDHGYTHFFEQEHEFKLPFNIQHEAESGALDGKKKPTPYQKIRGNVFPERSRFVSEYSAVCRCAPESRCGDNCINRIMNYLCGRDCPSGDGCENRSLAKRKAPNVKVVYTGSRGFGLLAMEDIPGGAFVIDYRGEVISLGTFFERCKKEYASGKNYYALAYDADEVIDAGMRGNEARFINHGCNPNLEVRKYQTLGDGMEEFEVGMWALRDISAGEELFYNYNFDTFGIAASTDLRTKCRCGAPNCTGYLGAKSAKRFEEEVRAREAAQAEAIKAKRAAKRAEAALKIAAPAAVTGKKSASRPEEVDKIQDARKKAENSQRLSRLEPSEAPSVVHLSEDVLLATHGTSPRHTHADTHAHANVHVHAGSHTHGHAHAHAPAHAHAHADSYAHAHAHAHVQAHTQADTPGHAHTHSHADFLATTPPLGALFSTGPIGARPQPTPGSHTGDHTSNPATPSGWTDWRDDESDSKKPRISGWAEWLRKKAGEHSRTRQQWEQFALDRRRGKAWMEKMMADFGVAEYLGGPALPYTPSMPLPPNGQPQRRGPPPGTPRPPRPSKEPLQPVAPGTSATVNTDILVMPARTVEEVERRAREIVQRIGRGDGSAEALASTSPFTTVPFSPVTPGVAIRLATAGERRFHPSASLADGTEPHRGSSGSSVFARASPTSVASPATHTLLTPSTPFTTAPLARAYHVHVAAPATSSSDRAHPEPIASSPFNTADAARAVPSESSFSHAAATVKTTPHVGLHLDSAAVDLELEPKLEPESEPQSQPETVEPAEPVGPVEPVERPAGAKKTAIKKRNGAPMGWAFVPADTPKKSGSFSVVEDVGPRSARRGRASILKEIDLRKSFGSR